MIRSLRRYACWRWNGARQKRPMSSIVLEPGVKEMILNDCRDFLRSEDWYAERGVLSSYSCEERIFTDAAFTLGIPFRRGYLLHGVPGRSVIFTAQPANSFSNILQREDLPHSFFGRRTRARHLCCQSLIERVRIPPFIFMSLKIRGVERKFP